MPDMPFANCTRQNDSTDRRTFGLQIQNLIAVCHVLCGILVEESIHDPLAGLFIGGYLRHSEREWNTHLCLWQRLNCNDGNWGHTSKNVSFRFPGIIFTMTEVNSTRTNCRVLKHWVTPIGIIQVQFRVLVDSIGGRV
eukprot:6487154-Amphidinium_carterae.2